MQLQWPTPLLSKLLGWGFDACFGQIRIQGQCKQKTQPYLMSEHKARGPCFTSSKGNKKGCAPHPAPFHKWQPPVQDSRIPRAVGCWGASGQSYSSSQDTGAGTEWLGSCCSSLLSSPKVIASSPTSRGLSVGKMQAVIYTSHSCHSRPSLVPRSLTDGFICNLHSVKKKEKKEADEMP